MIQSCDLALIGKVNKTHGIKGELSISIFDESVSETLSENSCLIMEMDGIFTPFFVKTVRPRSAEALLVTFDGYADQKEVTTWVGKDVYCERSRLPERPEIEDSDCDGLYAGQLIGFEARDEKDIVIGEIIDIDDSTENVLFVIEGGQNTVYVPVVDEFITEIDTERRIIRLDLPEGLLQI